VISRCRTERPPGVARPRRELAVDPQGRRLAAVGLQDRARRAALLEGRGQPRAAPGGRRRPCRRARVPIPGRPTARRTRPRTGRRSRRGRRPRRAGTPAWRRAPRGRRRPGSAPPGRSPTSPGCRSRRRCSAPPPATSRDRRPTCRTSPRCPAAARCRGGDDHDGALGRQLPDRRVEPGGACGVAPVRRLARGARGDVLGPAEVRAEEHQQRRTVPVGRHDGKRRVRGVVAVAPGRGVAPQVRPDRGRTVIVSPAA
jgi:hypothetical protein